MPIKNIDPADRQMNSALRSLLLCFLSLLPGCSFLTPAPINDETRITYVIKDEFNTRSVLRPSCFRLRIFRESENQETGDRKRVTGDNGLSPCLQFPCSLFFQSLLNGPLQIFNPIRLGYLAGKTMCNGIGKNLIVGVSA